MKIAIIVQRYGLQINGGAELHARQLAERLAQKHTVHVITTQSESYIDWDNNISQTREIVNGIEVFRFPSGKKDKYLAHKAYRRMRNLSKISIALRKIGLKKLSTSEILRFEKAFQNWLVHQGPYCPGMIEHLRQVKDRYDIFIFFSYLYFPTNAGLPVVKEKSVFIPTAHDEKLFYFPGYGKLFREVAFIMYNSTAEQKLVEKTYPFAQYTLHDVAGVGFEPVSFVPGDRPLKEPYFLYVGRLDRSKNVHELVDYFKRYAKNKNLRLVLVGKSENCKIKPDDKIVLTGFVTDEEKNNWLVHSEGLIIPSKHESLSMVTLEAMLAAIPVIANARAEVLRDHITASRAGFAYENYKEFKKAMDMLINMSSEDREKLSRNGRRYVEKNYSWNVILDKFEKAFNKISH